MLDPFMVHSVKASFSITHLAPTGASFTVRQPGAKRTADAELARLGPPALLRKSTELLTMTQTTFRDHADNSEKFIWCNP